ncbi:BrnT family toxin [Nitratifractor sp.]|uniref:BrnT family toxin n=1 Tax=Nitratifractor sp. TaxID=2268144 RepID=UPI0025DAC232|nr:BrnT family toxin [Nitratifractor sp.]
MRFEWDERKNRTNQTKHGISFEEAAQVFEDPMHLAKLDERFDYFEERWITLGKTENETILVVANLFFTEEGEEIIRIISARKATPHERSFYEKY